MSLTCPPTLDFAKLRAPPQHGEVLVVPEAAAWPAAIRENAEMLSRADPPLLRATLAHWRRKTREEIVGSDDCLVVATGHQPSFIHPGVWAKHVVAARMAGAVEGVPVHLVVDCDAPQSVLLAVPSVRSQRVELETVRFADLPAGHAYEQMPARTPERIADLERSVRQVMGERWGHSQMPTFFKALREAGRAPDWVHQMVAARQAVERGLGVTLEERRVSRYWGGPLLIDMLLNAPRFSGCYNRTLACYRQATGHRGTQHPVPDLAIEGERHEVPVWAYRDGASRRRVFVSRSGDVLQLFAGEVEIGAFSVRKLRSAAGFEEEPGGWGLRPRALALTIWARLLLADLFIHGIGGAKYDRITNAIIADYYGMTPPHIVCVSATLRLDLPTQPTTPQTLRRLQHTLRDIQYNPQRHLAPGDDVTVLLKRRAQAVRRAGELRETDPADHRVRRRVFQEIREINAALLAARPDAVARRRAELDRARDELRQNEIARGREYFFGLFGRGALEELAHALPHEGDFRV